MPFMQWDGSLGLGHAIIDQDHEVVADSIRRLLETIASASDGDAGERERQLDAAIAAVRDATEKHFRSEEWIMAASEYPGIEGHRRQHIELLAEFDSFTGELRQTPSDELAQVAKFLSDWFEVHLKVWDASLVRWLEALDPERHTERAQAAGG